MLLVLKNGVALDYLLLLFAFLPIFFATYYSIVSSCGNRTRRAIVDTE